MRCAIPDSVSQTTTDRVQWDSISGYWIINWCDWITFNPSLVVSIEFHGVVARGRGSGGEQRFRFVVFVWYAKGVIQRAEECVYSLRNRVRPQYRSRVEADGLFLYDWPKAIGKCSGVRLNCIRPRDDASLMGHSALNWLQWIVSCYVPLGSLVVTTFGVLDSFWWHRSNKIYDAYLANGRIARKLWAGHQIVDNELIGDSKVSFQYSRTCHGRIFFSNQKTIYWLVV